MPLTRLWGCQPAVRRTSVKRRDRRALCHTGMGIRRRPALSRCAHHTPDTPLSCTLPTHFDRDVVLLGGRRKSVDERTRRPERMSFLSHPRRLVFGQHVGEVAHGHGRHTFLVQPFHQVARECAPCVIAPSRPRGTTVKSSGTCTVPHGVWTASGQSPQWCRGSG